MLTFRNSRQIQQYLRNAHNLLVSQDFIRAWCNANGHPITDAWYIEDLLEMGNEGDGTIEESEE